jgi:hypothetical protein
MFAFLIEAIPGVKEGEERRILNSHFLTKAGLSFTPKERVPG